MQTFDKAFIGLERPFAWVDLDALDANIEFIAAKTKKPVRIATKSIRSTQLLRYIAERLPETAGFMTFTAAETLYLLEQGFNQLLIGYPVMEENAVKKLLFQIKAGKDITFMVDHIEQVEFLERMASGLDVVIPICIDVNVSDDYRVLYFGTKRSPLNSFEKVANFLYAIADKQVQVRGVMAYEAQVAGVPDLPDETVVSRIKSKLISQLKKRSVMQVEQAHHDTINIIRHLEDPIFINAGGSGSIESTNRLEVTEMTIGSAFLAPALFDRYDSLALQKASGFALAVVRQFDEETFVCHGGGYIASGTPGVDRLPAFYEAGRFRYLSLEGAGEVQTPIVDSQKALHIGDTVYFRHAKAGELCERFPMLHAVRGDVRIGTYTTYRGDGQCFL
ncbi:alanine racemase [Lysinibacillus odysseyi]|uniref:Alanine racemase N-terminal domain-containing protein n=1 Tax=Lysinibacillus odysseyi 34hs-1 = NBRC 100172 TaxID=1220589 RepID=A0A0A3IBT2_9BACI|nr:alanine racemase [Lysinibacillus odysseyi]KGR82189.1 hypothetical protein CD32_23195 [Lysinibacillus odysseyi 34hs-1 = NBRC 100172]